MKKFIIVVIVLGLLSACSSDLEEYSLEIKLSGRGSVEPEPGLYFHESGTKVDLKAEAKEGWEFVAWQGARKDEAAQIRVIVDSDLKLQAYFKEVETDDWSYNKEELNYYTYSRSDRKKEIELGYLAEDEGVFLGFIPKELKTERNNGGNSYFSIFNGSLKFNYAGLAEEEAVKDTRAKQTLKSAEKISSEEELKEKFRTDLKQVLDRTYDTEVLYDKQGPKQKQSISSKSTVSQTRDFYVYPYDQKITAELKAENEKAAIYLEEDTTVSKQLIEQLAEKFEAKIHAKVIHYFATLESDKYDWDNNGKTTIVLTNARSKWIKGYTRPRDFLFNNGDTITNSNEGNIVYLNTAYIEQIESNNLRRDSIFATLAHELQHLIYLTESHAAERSGKDSVQLWINEGFSVLAEHLTGYVDLSSDKRVTERYFAQPEQEPLMQWGSNSNYGGVGLFALYLKEKHGPKILKEIISSSQNVVETINDNYGDSSGVDNYFADRLLPNWAAANLTSKQKFIDNQSKYETIQFEEQPKLTEVSGPTEYDFNIYSTGVKYFNIKGANSEVDLEFQLQNYREDVIFFAYKYSKVKD